MLISDENLKKLVKTRQLLSNKQLEVAVEQTRTNQDSLLNTLISTDLISEEELYREIAKEKHLPFVRLNRNQLDGDLLRIIPEKIAKKHKVVAFKKDENGIGLALVDPEVGELVEMIQKKTSRSVKKYLTTSTDIKKSLLLYRKSLNSAIELILSGKSTLPLENAPIGKVVDLLIEYAYQDRASDIHIEPGENSCLIRFRIDGLLHDAVTLPKDLNDRIVSRIKILSKLRTDEHLTPQDGKFRFPLEEENLDIRVSIVPVVDGEKIVLRLLTSRAREYTLNSLGLSGEDLKKVTRSLDKPYGLILSTGPTGSGKTTTIYALIKLLNNREGNITTIEDPIEYRIKGVNQIQVNPKANLTFANGLSSILRQDPNIIFVGEIRDSQTADITVNAGLTGHLVFSTVHTNTAVGALPRLMEMGIEPFLLASTVNIIIAQRLMRKICEECKSSYVISRQELSKSLTVAAIRKTIGSQNKIKLYRGDGCPVCHQTGYVGRIGVFEVLPLNKHLRQLIIAKADTDKIEEVAQKEGMVTMFEDGFKKTIAGITTIEELLRVTKAEAL